VLLNNVSVRTYTPAPQGACAGVGTVHALGNLSTTSYAPGQQNTFTLRRPTPTCTPAGPPGTSCYETFYSGFGVNAGWASYGANIVALVMVTY
jgi:hypothetical protein